MCTWLQVSMCQKRTLDLLTLDLPAVVSYLIWMLGFELKPSAGAVRTPTSLAISHYWESYCFSLLHTLIITLGAWVAVMGAGGGHWNRGHRWWGCVTPRPTKRFPLGEILTKDFCLLRTILLTLGSLKIKSFFHFCISMDYLDMIDFDCKEGQGRESTTTLLWFLLLWKDSMTMATLQRETFDWGWLIGSELYLLSWWDVW